MMKKQEEKIKKSTFNYPKDSHAAFCKRCLTQYNGGVCPMTGCDKPSGKCQL